MMTINFHGVRGSHPAPDAQMVKYGGNTACVEIVKANDEGLQVPLIIDAGTGIIKLGYGMAKKLRAGEYSGTFPLLFTHLHPDHTEGFTFFKPNFLPFCKIYLLGIRFHKKDMVKVLKKKMEVPIYPIQYDDMEAERERVILRDGMTFWLSQNGEPFFEKREKGNEKPLFQVEVMRAHSPSHPQQGAAYYRITDPLDGSSVACIWDIESHPGGDVRVINFSRGATVMIHDTQYTEEEYACPEDPVQGFGHSSYAMAGENAAAAGVKYLCSFHYNPRHTDKFLDEAAGRFSAPGGKFEFIMSREGLSLTLEGGEIRSRKLLKESFAL